MRALESQVAYIDGDPTNSDGLELYYYRFVGPFFLEIVLALTTTCAQSGSTVIHPIETSAKSCWVKRQCTSAQFPI